MSEQSAADAARRQGWWSRVRGSLTHDIGRVEAAELIADSREAGATPVAECCTGERVDVHGTVRSVIIRPRGRVPAFEAEVYDGTGRLRVIWLGRRLIQGLEPGRMLTLTGRITDVGGQRTIFNPRYELSPRPGP